MEERQWKRYLPRPRHQCDSAHEHQRQESRQVVGTYATLRMHRMHRELEMLDTVIIGFEEFAARLLLRTGIVPRTTTSSIVHELSVIMQRKHMFNVKPMLNLSQDGKATTCAVTMRYFCITAAVVRPSRHQLDTRVNENDVCAYL